MKPPRKPRPTSGKSSPRRAAPSPARSASREESRRVAEAWGVKEERPAKGGKSGGRAAKSGASGTAASATVRPKRGLRTDSSGKASASQDRREGPRADTRKKSDGSRSAYSRSTLSRNSSSRAAASPRPSAARLRKDIPAAAAHKTGGPPRAEQRIAKLLARAGIASRREIERMIAEGRIAINGLPLDTPATLLTSLDGVTVDGAPVADAETTRLFMFHKPAGCLTAERDFSGRKTIYDVLPADLPRLMPVGRLDMNTEGLLLLTNDGELKRKMELPSTGVERTYRARAFGEISQAQLEELIHGVEVEGVRYGRIDANLERRTGRNQWIEMTLTEGKNREVRRVLEYLGLKVNRLIRTRYGAFELGDSAPGAIAEAKPHELEAFIRDMRRRDK